MNFIYKIIISQFRSSVKEKIISKKKDFSIFENWSLDRSFADYDASRWDFAIF